jgi:hypothetical protein
MLEHYHKFCQAFSFTPESDQSFSRKLTYDFHLKSKQFRVDDSNKRCYYWQDVKLRDWDKEEQERLSALPDFNDPGTAGLQ